MIQVDLTEMRVTDEEKQQGVESVVLCASAWRVKEGEVVVNSQVKKEDGRI